MIGSLGLFIVFGVIVVVAALVLRMYSRPLADPRGPRSSLWSLTGPLYAAQYFWAMLLLYFVEVQAYRVASGYGWWGRGGWSRTGTNSLYDLQSGMVLVLIVFAIPAVVWSWRRAETVRLPPAVGLLVLLPVVNYVLLLVLSMMPDEAAESRIHDLRINDGARLLDRFVPRTQIGSAAAAILATAVVTLVFVLLSVYVVGEYGWFLFVLLPTLLGLFSALVYSYREPRTARACMSVALLALGAVTVGLVALAIEGVICLLMAAPLAVPLALLGGWFGYLIQRPGGARGQMPQIAGALLLMMPFVLVGEHDGEHGGPREPEALTVTTTIEIAAPPEQVWPHVLHTTLPEERELLFHTGIAYPTLTELRAPGVGGRRECVFSTGTIIEPVTGWEPGRRLRFAITNQPPLMRELSPYDIHPPHLDGGFLSSQEGEFVLASLPGGRTLLTGTSYYQLRIWPAQYWRLWTDYVAHRIHVRVMNEIKRQAEATASRKP